jgi:hypothetical protein
LAVLVSDQLRAVGPRHASETRQLPSKPCRPLNSYFTTPRYSALKSSSLIGFYIALLGA